MDIFKELEDYIAERIDASDRVCEGLTDDDPVRKEEGAIHDTYSLLLNKLSKMKKCQLNTPLDLTTIIVEVNGGVAEIVSDLPPGIDVEIRDNDV